MKITDGYGSFEFDDDGRFNQDRSQIERSRNLRMISRGAFAMPEAQRLLVSPAIRVARSLGGISSKELARALGLSHSCITGIETRHGRPGLKTYSALKRIAHHLGVRASISGQRLNIWIDPARADPRLARALDRHRPDNGPLTFRFK